MYLTLPSSVTAAKMVAECGDQAASPIGLVRSNDMTGRWLSPSHSFSVQSAEADKKMRVWMLFHFTAYTVMSCPAACAFEQSQPAFATLFSAWFVQDPYIVNCYIGPYSTGAWPARISNCLAYQNIH